MSGIDPGKIVRVGVFHSADRCALCGASREQADFREATLPETRARAMVCVDVVACARRRYLWRSAA